MCYNRENEPGGILMADLPNCPKCDSDLTYEDRKLFDDPMCDHEGISEIEVEDTPKEKVSRDANGNVLIEGDDVSVIKDLKIKGASSVVKQGTIVKNIKLIDEDHDIDCKVPGHGVMKLKTEFVKKL